MTDIFREEYVHIDGRAFGFEDYQIFAKRRGNYIFRVSYIPAIFEEGNDAFQMPWIRYMIIEIGKDNEGNAIVKDYMFFDLNLADDRLMDDFKSVMLEGVESAIFEIMQGRLNNANRQKESDASYF